MRIEATAGTSLDQYRLAIDSSFVGATDIPSGEVSMMAAKANMPFVASHIMAGS